MSGLPLPVAPNARIDLLKSIADPSMKPKLKKVDPNQIKDRSKPTVPVTTIANNNSTTTNNNNQINETAAAKS